MKKSTLRSGCVLCALLLMASSFPKAVYAEGPASPLGPLAVAPEARPEVTPGPQPGEAEAPKAAEEVTEEEIDAFFDGTVFVGDSVMMGYMYYAMARDNTWLGRPQFLAAVSFSTYSALRPVTAKSIHPLYQGQKYLVEDAIALMGAKRVFIFFGLNDITITGINGTRNNYVELVNRIKAQSPDIEVHLMSMTYVVHGKEKGNLTNDNVRRYNDTMRALAEEQGWGFVDVANPLADANGDLEISYSSDKYVHLKNSAYAVWSDVLRAYARQYIEDNRRYLPEGQAASEVARGPLGPVAAAEPETAAAETAAPPMPAGPLGPAPPGPVTETAAAG